MANNQPLSPQGYNVNDAPVNTNPFWEAGGGEPITGGLPPGGSPGQILEKKTATDYDAQWVDPTTGGVTMAQVRAITDPIEEAVTSNKAGQDAINVELWAAINENTPPDLTALTERVTTVEANLAQEVEDRVAAIQALQAQIDAIEGSDIEALEQAVATLQSEVEALQAALEAIDLTEINAQLAAHTQSIAALESITEQHTTDISQLREDLTAETTEREADKVELQGGISANASLIAAVSQRVTILESWQAIAVATLDQLNNDLEAEATTREENDEALGERIDAVIASVNSLKAQWDADIAEAIGTLPADVAALTEDVQQLSTKVDTYDGRITNAEEVAEAASETAANAVAVAEGVADDLAAFEVTFEGGTSGQVLTRTGDNGYTWEDAQGGSGGIGQLRFTTNFLGSINLPSSGITPNPIGTPLTEATYYDISIGDVNILTGPYVTLDVTFGSQVRWGSTDAPLQQMVLATSVGIALFNSTNVTLPVAAGYFHVKWTPAAQTISVYPFSDDIAEIRGFCTIQGRSISLVP